MFMKYSIGLILLLAVIALLSIEGRKKNITYVNLSLLDSTSLKNGKINTMPSFEELNRKDYYLLEMIDNNKPLTVKFYCIGKGYRFSFDPNEVINFCKKSMEHSTDYEISQRGYENILALAKKSLNGNVVKFNVFLLTEMLPNCKPHITQVNSGSTPKSLIVRHYKTMCSNGKKDLDLVTSKGDTVSIVTHLEHCMN
jgi:hypothetical protein